MRVLLALLLALLTGLPAAAQWVLNPDTNVINATTSCAGGTAFTRTFDVASGSTVADVDLGLDADHSWRGDIRARLTSPGGTTVEVLSADTGAAGNLNNYRIRLDDSAAILVNTGTHQANTATTAPSYGDRVRPSNPLSAFNGQAAGGTWTLELCDAFPAQDNGTLLRTTLFVTPTQPPQPPAFACAAGAAVPFAWGAPGSPTGWAAGTLTNGYTAGSIPFNIAITGDTGTIIARNGTATPVSDTEMSPGGTGRSVLVNVDFSSRTQSLTLTLNLGTAGQGVGGARFRLQDVDRRDWTDRVIVSGSLGGAPVPVGLTPGLANRVDGNAVVGTAVTPSATPESEAVVQFDQPVDQVVLVYGDAPNAPADPLGQIIGFFADLELCPLPQTELSAVKSVAVDDPGNTGLYMTPGNRVIYTITVTHGAASTRDADDIDITDTLPATLEFVSSAQSGFTSGSFANQNCPLEPCIVNFENGVLPQGVTGEILVTALIR